MTSPKLTNLRQLLGDDVAATILKPDRKPRAARKRPVPKLKRHKYGWAWVTYKVNGRRAAVYFSKWGTKTAAVRYNRWAARWPRQLGESLPSGKWPKLRLLTFRGRTMTMARWAAEFGLKASTLRNRLDVQKMPLAEALTQPKQPPHFAKVPESSK